MRLPEAIAFGDLVRRYARPAFCRPPSRETRLMSDDILEVGKSIRAEVIGEARSKAALAGATDFDRPFQELALKYCWGEVWGRPGLDRRTRSIVNLSMLSGQRAQDPRARGTDERSHEKRDPGDLSPDHDLCGRSERWRGIQNGTRGLRGARVRGSRLRSSRPAWIGPTKASEPGGQAVRIALRSGRPPLRSGWF